MLGQPHAVVAVAVEALRADAAKVADARQCDVDQAIEELVHPLAAKRHAAADLVSFSQPERTDGLLGLHDLRALTRDHAEVLGRLLHPVLVLERLAHAHVQNDLREFRQAETILATELLAERRENLFRIFLEQPRRGCRGVFRRSSHDKRTS